MPGSSGARPTAGASPVATKPAAAHAMALPLVDASAGDSMPASRISANPMEVAMVAVLV